MNLTAQPGKAPAGNISEKNDAALLGAFCLFLSTLEYLIPKPLPFMRIGLANVPLMLALDLFTLKSYALLVLVKVLGQALITGTLFSYVFLFSLAGTLSSAAVMYLLRRFLGPARISFTGIGIAGAFVSNGSQLVLARLFIFGEGTRFLAPPFLAAGIVTGAALGMFCEAFAARSLWMCRRREVVTATSEEGEEFLTTKSNRTKGSQSKKEERKGGLFLSGDLFLAGAVMSLLFLFNRSTMMRIVQFLFFWGLAWMGGKKTRPLVTALVMLGIILFNLFPPYGRVLAQWGPLSLTQGSLLGGLHRAVTLEGLILLSGVTVRRDLRLPGVLGGLLGESFGILARLNGRTSGLFQRKARSFPGDAPVSGGRFVRELDRLMVELSAEQETGPAVMKADSPAIGPDTAGKRTLPGIMLLSGAVLVTTALTLLPRFIPCW
jgi:heptaprenyl diphosphate synthase